LDTHLISRQRIAEVGRVFLRFGLTAFGGPAAHISMFHDEFVKRRKWLDEQHFLDLLGATNLIPGPNSTEMAIHLGYLRAGWKGLILAGTSFIAPAMLIVTVIAYFYVKYGSTPQAEWILYGVEPVVIAIILQALVSLSKKAITGYKTLLVAVLAIIIYFLKFSPLLALIIGGALMLGFSQISKIRDFASIMFLPVSSLLVTQTSAAQPYSLPVLFLTFLKIGSVLYGSGYVLLAFLNADFVRDLGWLTNQQLLDAVAIGQFTPGPVFTTATFIGYILGGIPGALAATIGIFLPSFVFVAISNPIIPKLRNSPVVGHILDGINAASLGLMAAVLVQLARTSISDTLTVLVAVISAILLLKFRVNTTWLILGGILIGLLSGIIPYLLATLR
jgi:chromate transporter